MALKNKDKETLIDTPEHEAAESPEMEQQEHETGEEAMPEGPAEVAEYINNCKSAEELDQIQSMLDKKREELGETEGPAEFSTEGMPT